MLVSWLVFASTSGNFQLVFNIAAKRTKIDMQAEGLSNNKCQTNDEKNKRRQRNIITIITTIIDFAFNDVILSPNRPHQSQSVCGANG